MVFTGGGPSVVLTEEVLVVVLASEVLCMEPVGGGPHCGSRTGQFDYVGGP